MKFYYINSRGEKLDLSDYPYLFQEGDLLDSSWEKDNDKDRYRNIRKTAGEKTFKIAVVPDYTKPLSERKREYVNAINHIADVLEYDVCNNAYGKLFTDSGYYLSFHLISRARKKATNFLTRQQKNHGKLPWILKNETRGIRTPDNLIKSQVLYRLS